MTYRYFEIGKKMRLIESDKPLELEQLQSLIGGYIEFAPLLNGNTICVDEEGLIKNLPYNPAFSQKDTPVDISLGLRGNILEGKLDAEGEFVGI